jgi:hypothetical protein
LFTEGGWGGFYSGQESLEGGTQWHYSDYSVLVVGLDWCWVYPLFFLWQWHVVAMA